MLSIIKRYKRVILLMIAGGSLSLFQWVMISGMTKIFGTQTVGVYSGIVAVITPLTTFGNLSLRAMQIVDIKDEYKIENVLFLKRISSVCIVLIVIIYMLIEGGDATYYQIGFFALIAKVVVMYSDGVYGKLIKDNRIAAYAFSELLHYAASACLFIIISIATKSVALGMAAYVLPHVGVFLLFDLKQVGGIHAIWKPTATKDEYKYMLGLCAPLAIVQMINTLYDSIPKLFLQATAGDSVLGIFSATAYISAAGGLAVTAITTAYASKLAKLLSQNRIREYFKVIAIEEIIVVVAFVALIGVFRFWGKQILTFLYTNEFANYVDVVLLLILAIGLNFMSRVLGTACTAAHLNKQQLATALVCVASMSAICALTIPRFGMYGAAISMCAAYILKSTILLARLIIRFSRKKVNL